MADVSLTQNVSFTQMKDGTAEDYALLQRHETLYTAAVADRLIDALGRLRDGLDGFQVDRLQHSLQTATRAENDGADIEMVVAALLHDIGDELAPENHSQLAAAVLRPYVRAEVTWVVEMHGLFQTVYSAHHRGLDPDAREVYRDHAWYASCVSFCERWDQASFDPDFPTRSLEHFEPMVREIFGRAPFDPVTGCM